MPRDREYKDESAGERELCADCLGGRSTRLKLMLLTDGDVGRL